MQLNIFFNLHLEDPELEKFSSMAVETVQKLIEAQKLLSGVNTEEVHTCNSLRTQVERMSFRLLKKYKETADSRYFTAFYSISNQTLNTHAYKQCSKYSFPADPHELVNKLYIILYEKLLAPEGNIPLSRLFPWCFTTLLNLAREEFRIYKKLKPLTHETIQAAATPPLLDTIIENEKGINDLEKLNKVFHILKTGKSGLSIRDRDIMLMYYEENCSIERVSEKFGLSKSHIWVILSRSRNRISKLFTDPA